MSVAYPWYAAVSGEDLMQGDLFRDCPDITPTEAGGVGTARFTVVVLSHSCDMANHRLRRIQVCPVWPLSQATTEVPFLSNRRGQEELRRGNLPGYHLLHRCELQGLEREFLVVDFRSQFSVPVSSIKGLARQQSPRVRLLPYREHLAQAFARFFMRVGLPVDVPPF